MKFNKWTLGLAALGVVTLASAAKADEKSAPTFLETAVSSTTISGYVSASAHWDIGTGNGSNPGYAFNTTAKADGFVLDVVKIAISKPLDESEWASGYNVELLYGPDANALGTSPGGGVIGSDFAIKQAYVELRTPVGNGIDWKFGVFDTIIGYEVFDAGSNPNYTRSYGYSIEPTTHTGLLASYKFADWISATVGIANTTGPIIGGTTIGAPFIGASAGSSSPTKAESYKTYMGSIALTAPQSWGALAGSTLYGGVVHGLGGGIAQAGVLTSWYAGAMINTPVKGLRFGASYDYLGVNGSTIAGVSDGWANSVALYASYQATDKLSLHARAEYFWEDNGAGAPLSTPTGASGPISSIWALTGTIQYDLWKNVLSRLEVRWDHANSSIYGGGQARIGGTTIGVPAGFGSVPDNKDHVLIAANLIYKF